MKLFLTIFLAGSLLAAPAAAQNVRVIAVADFVDESSDGIYIRAPQLSEILAGLIATRAGTRYKVVSSADVRGALRARGYGPRDLVSPTRAAQIAAATGADLIVTGRWTHLDADAPEAASPPMIGFPSFGQAVLEIRVLDVGAHRILLQEAFSGIAQGGGRIGALWWAALGALTKAADRIGRL